MSDLVGNPEDRFSRVAAHLILCLFQRVTVIIPCDVLRQSTGSVSTHYYSMVVSVLM